MADTKKPEEQIIARAAAFAEDILAARILIVDDMSLMRQMIGLCLSEAGFSALSFAEDGVEALEMIDQEMPELVILDLNMPKMSGHEVCKALRGDEKTKDLPILVQSASETPEERTEVFASGATDFVSKPINQPEMLARVCMHLENRFLIRSLQDFQAHMQDELTMARDMQQALLPGLREIQSVEKECNLRIESLYRASFELGGDLWGGWPLGGGKYGIYVLDVVGHGVTAALNTFRIHATMARFNRNRLNPARFLNRLNQELYASLPTGQFSTMFYAVLDTANGHLTYAGAGAPRPLIVSERGVRLLDSSGIPIGIAETPGYENKTETLEPGESLFCYSDVLVEASDSAGEILGEDGFASMVEGIACQVPQAALFRTILKQFLDGLPGPLPDDLTAVSVYRV